MMSFWKKLSMGVGEASLCLKQIKDLIQNSFVSVVLCRLKLRMATFNSPRCKNTKEPRGKSMANCHSKQIAVCELSHLNYPSRIKVWDCEKLKMLPKLGSSEWIKNLIRKLNCRFNLPLWWRLNYPLSSTDQIPLWQGPGDAIFVVIKIFFKKIITWPVHVWFM